MGNLCPEIVDDRVSDPLSRVATRVALVSKLTLGQIEHILDSSRDIIETAKGACVTTFTAMQPPSPCVIGEIEDTKSAYCLGKGDKVWKGPFTIDEAKRRESLGEDVRFGGLRIISSHPRDEQRSASNAAECEGIESVYNGVQLDVLRDWEYTLFESGITTSRPVKFFTRRTFVRPLYYRVGDVFNPTTKECWTSGGRQIVTACALLHSLVAEQTAASFDAARVEKRPQIAGTDTVMNLHEEQTLVNLVFLFLFLFLLGLMRAQLCEVRL